MRQVGNDQQEASKRKTSNRTTKERSPGGFGHPRDDIHIGPRETSYIGLNLQFPVHRLLQEMELAPISCCAGRSARRMPTRSRTCHGIGTMGLQAKQKGPTGPRPAAAGAYSAIHPGLYDDSLPYACTVHEENGGSLSSGTHALLGEGNKEVPAAVFLTPAWASGDTFGW